MSIRPWHRRVARLLVAALLFTQGAVVAHACRAALDTAAVTAAAAPAPEPPCPYHHAEAAPADQADAQPAPALDATLCKAHCDQTQTSVSAKLQIDTTAMAACIAPMQWPSLAPVASAVPLPAVRDPGPPPGSPPLYIAYAVLRR